MRRCLSSASKLFLRKKTLRDRSLFFVFRRRKSGVRAPLNFDFGEIFDSWGKIPNNHYSAGKISPDGSYDAAEDKESFAFLDSVLKDDKSEFVSHAKRLFNGEELESGRFESLKLLNVCCGYDSINCASSIINGDVGSVPYINDVDAGSGFSPLHAAAEANAPRCVEMLLKRRARTDIKSKDGRGLVPLELSLCNGSLHVTWNPNGDSIGDLILQLGDKDMTVVKLLAEKTKDLETVACTFARAGAIVPLTTLLIVATDRIREATVALQDDDDIMPKPKTTIYESVIQEALRSNSSMQSVCNQKRMLLLQEIELLQLFGAAVFSEFVDKQTSSLMTIVQAGDEAVLELLVNTNIDVNETDAEGNTVLQCSLKGSSVPHKQQTRIMNLLIAHGARITQKNKLGLSAAHFAAAIGNLSALEFLLAANPELVHAKTVIKETPLFFAVKNNHLDCVELLLQCGASTEIHNLRKQRPIELTQSQDIRFLLNPTNISCFSKETELAQLRSAVPPTKADDKETSFQGTSVPLWLKKFEKWLPRYLQDSSDSFGRTRYPLSSLKADFHATFGMDLDHSSLGFSKLIDFVKSFPKLCQMKVVPVGKSGPATHWVLLPSKFPQLKGRPPEPLIISNNESRSPNKLKASSTPDPICSDSFIQQTPVSKTLKPEPEPQPPLVASYSNHAQVSKSLKPEPEPQLHLASSYSNHAHVSKTLKPEPEPFLAASYNNHHQLKHPVLETLAKIRNSTSIFFLREFDFYQVRAIPLSAPFFHISNPVIDFLTREVSYLQSYETSLRQGMCFWCNKSMLLWANFPCRHKLWCSSCKQEVTQSAGRDSLEEQHRCVVCDVKVERFILSPPFGFDHNGLPNDAELATSFLQFLSIRNTMYKQQTIAQIHHHGT
ncbi:unnamed protein product [Arabis nemorensis]|uniref:HTH OST-type domain-containing protein n=1 Tax=Arabis nemorensis TaxID=586526 RepID=A0A565BSP9_9BRAS|nr:unnamed protein product [Arabis nemorensis]